MKVCRQAVAKLTQDPLEALQVSQIQGVVCRNDQVYSWAALSNWTTLEHQSTTRPAAAP